MLIWPCNNGITHDVEAFWHFICIRWRVSAAQKLESALYVLAQLKSEVIVCQKVHQNAFSGLVTSVTALLHFFEFLICSAPSLPKPTTSDNPQLDRATKVHRLLEVQLYTTNGCGKLNHGSLQLFKPLCQTSAP